MNFKQTARTFNEPQLKFTQGGLAICEFGIVVPRFNQKKLKEEGKQDADFLNCFAMGKTAEFLGNNLGKGKFVDIEGSIQIDTYEKEGKKQYYTKIKVDHANIIEWKNKDKGQELNPDDDFSQLDMEDSDIPF